MFTRPGMSQELPKNPGTWQETFITKRWADHGWWLFAYMELVTTVYDMGMGQNLVPLVNIKIAGKWMFIPLKMVCIGIDP